MKRIFALLFALANVFNLVEFELSDQHKNRHSNINFTYAINQVLEDATDKSSVFTTKSETPRKQNDKLREMEYHAAGQTRVSENASNFSRATKFGAELLDNLPLCNIKSHVDHPNQFDNCLKTPETGIDYNCNSGVDNNATICHQISPQLLMCNKTVHQQIITALPIQFYVSNGTLHIKGSDLQVQLGDYLWDDDDRIVLCSESIKPKHFEIPRCNYIILHVTEYDRLSNGSWELKSPFNYLIDRPDLLTVWYTADRHMVYLCYPLDVSMVNCVKLGSIYPTEYRVWPNHSLYQKSDSIFLDIGQYFIAEDAKAYFCLDDREQEDVNVAADNLYIICNFASAFCLLLTAMYQLTDTGRMSCHARSLFMHVVSLIIANVANAINIILYPSKSEQNSPEGCYAIFVITYLGYMCALFWLQVMSFDVWLSFHTLQISKYHCTIDIADPRRFIYYSIYASSLPLLLCILSLVVDQFSSIQRVLRVYPDIISYCWFNNRRSEWVFHYTPQILIIFSNIFFFLFSVVTLKVLNKDTRTTRGKPNMEKYFVCLKLFIIMCFSYVADILFFSLGEQSGYIIWYVEDAITSLQGVAIFLVYVCKKQNYDKLKEWFKGTLSSNGNENDTDLTSSVNNVS